MRQLAIISVDGHVKASRAGYRDYFEKQYLDEFDEWVTAQEASGVPDAGNLNHDFGVDSQWDSDKRLRVLEDVGVVAEVLFPNGLPFQASRLEDLGASRDPALDRQARLAYNRWLADFCAAVPGGAPVRPSSPSMTTSTSRCRMSTGPRRTASAGS